MSADLMSAGMETFLPLHVVEKKVGGRRKRVMAPVISNLLFVRAEKQQLQTFKAAPGRERLQYICHHGGAMDKKPIVVPDEQMTAFIRIYEEGQHELTTELADLQPGTRVRVIEGPFTGLVGTFRRVKGHRARRFVVLLDGLAAISMQMEPSCLELLKEE